jgi:hypothetical protein
MEQGLDKANITILGLHRDFSAMGGVMSDDIHALDCRQQSLNTTVGKPRSIPGIMAGNIWEALSVMGQNSQAPGLDSVALDIQDRLGTLAASLIVTNQDASILRIEKTDLAAVVKNLEQQLASTLEISLGLRSRLDGLLQSSSSATTMIPRNVFDIADRFHQLPIVEEPIPPLENERIHFQNSDADAISCPEFNSIIDNLRAEIGLQKKQSASRGSISCFQDLLPGVQSLEDVH